MKIFHCYIKYKKLICLNGINTTFVLISVLRNKLANCVLFQRDFPCKFCQTYELTTDFHPQTADTHKMQKTSTSSTTEPPQETTVIDKINFCSHYTQ